MGKDFHLRTIKTYAKCSGCSYQKIISSLLYLSRRHQNHSVNGPSQKCANFMVLAVTRILVLTCIPFFTVVVSTPRMRNTKQRCESFLTNWRLVLQQHLSTYPMRPPKASIRILIS